MALLSRRVLDLAAAASLALALVAAAGWAQSYWHADYIGAELGRWGLGCRSVRGYLCVQWFTFPGSTPARTYIDRARATPGDDPLGPSRYRFAGFGFFDGSTVRNGSFIAVVVPDWSAVLAALVLPAAARSHRRWGRRARRTRRGQCLTCGYDLRGSAGAACPECGAARGAVP